MKNSPQVSKNQQANSKSNIYKMASGGPSGNNVFKNLGIPMNYVPRPRAPPRLIRPPSPLCMERPQPLVPDVSLIIDSAATSFHSNPEQSLNEDINVNNVQNRFALPRNVAARSQENTETSPNINFANYYPTPSPNPRGNDIPMPQSRSVSKEDSGNGGSPDDTTTSENLPMDESNTSRKSERSFQNGYEALKGDIATVMRSVNSQAESINQINSQLQKIIAFQEKILVHVTRKEATVSKCVQTDNEGLKIAELTTESRRISEDLTRKGQNDKSTGLQARRSIPTSEAVSSQNTTKRTSQSIRQELLKSKVIVPSPPPEERKTGGEDLSVILRNLQISNVQHPSSYSDTSMKSIECPPFNDETFHNENSSYVGPSASALDSDVEDDPAETVLPSVTYYNNLLSTVNRVLDGGQPRRETNKSPSDENKGENRPSSSASKRHFSSKNRGSASSSPGASSHLGTVSYNSSGSSSSGSIGVGRDDYKENLYRGTTEANSLVNRFLEQQKGASSNADRDDYAVESTKKYLQSLGVQFDNPTQQQQPSPPLSQKQNYMIQQNVYNSIYIPTVNCVPVISESVNSNSGVIDNLARKYIPSGERNHYEMLAGKQNEHLAETTVYGMTPGNLSFATKEYLKRHGLVGQTEQASAPAPRPSFPAAHSDKVLDMTAIRNQPKLL